MIRIIRWTGRLARAFGALAATLARSIGFIGCAWLGSVILIIVVAGLSAPPPSSPEALAAAQQAREAKREVERQEREWEELKTTRVTMLGANLKNLGYDVTVQRGNFPGEVVITSDEFAKTDERVRFLALLRGKHSPMVGACDSGFASVRLRSGWFGFNEVYELNCYSIRSESL